MNTDKGNSPPDTLSPGMPRYEAPRIESILTPEELEREVLYAGVGGPSN